MSQLWRGVAGLSIITLAIAGCGATRAAGPQPVHALARPAPRPEAIVINPQIGMTFTPVSAPAGANLTAQQAWARFMRHLGNHHTFIPASVHAQLGRLTLPVGPNGPDGGETYTARNELTYGYSSPSGCITMNPLLRPPPNARCVYWDFLSARTGQQVVSTFQKTGRWHWLIDHSGL